MTTVRPHHSIKIMWLLCLALCTACSDNTPRITALANDSAILAFGDSITYGTGAAQTQSYPSVLARLTGLNVINAGVPGEVTATGSARLPGLLDQYHPALLILCHGGNDLLRKIDTAATRDHLLTMIAAASQRGIPVLLVGVPAPGLFFLESAELYNDLAAQQHLLYEGDVLPDIYSDNALKSDQIHPNAAGYRLFAEAIFKLLQVSGAIH